MHRTSRTGFVSLSLGIAAVIFAACGLTAAAAEDPAAASQTELSPMLVEVNAHLASIGSPVRVEMAEYLTTGEGGEVGRAVYARNWGNKRLGEQFVPHDPRRGGRATIEWIFDPTNPTADVPVADVSAAVQRAMDTWDSQTCSGIDLVRMPDAVSDLGFVSALLGFGGSVEMPDADIVHAGWLPGEFFDQLIPGGSARILGVTFTFLFGDDERPSDIDGDHQWDVAFREIYYNDAFTWGIDLRRYDIQTVALHESGHGLSQAHFGGIFRTMSNGKLHFTPRAVMNSAYGGILHDLLGTDMAGHCGLWASWPE